MQETTLFKKVECYEDSNGNLHKVENKNEYIKAEIVNAIADSYADDHSIEVDFESCEIVAESIMKNKTKIIQLLQNQNSEKNNS